MATLLDFSTHFTNHNLAQFTNVNFFDYDKHLSPPSSTPAPPNSALNPESQPTSSSSSSHSLIFSPAAPSSPSLSSLNSLPHKSRLRSTSLPNCSLSYATTAENDLQYVFLDYAANPNPSSLPLTDHSPRPSYLPSSSLPPAAPADPDDSRKPGVSPQPCRANRPFPGTGSGPVSIPIPVPSMVPVRGFGLSDLRTRAAVEEDKRRRNTAASARFRIKKKLREKELEHTAREMTNMVTILEARVSQLEVENQWLRSIVIDKHGKLPKPDDQFEPELPAKKPCDIPDPCAALPVSVPVAVPVPVPPAMPGGVHPPAEQPSTASAQHLATPVPVPPPASAHSAAPASAQVQGPAPVPGPALLPAAAPAPAPVPPPVAVPSGNSNSAASLSLAAGD